MQLNRMITDYCQILTSVSPLVTTKQNIHSFTTTGVVMMCHLKSRWVHVWSIQICHWVLTRLIKRGPNSSLDNSYIWQTLPRPTDHEWEHNGSVLKPITFIPGTKLAPNGIPTSGTVCVHIALVLQHLCFVLWIWSTGSHPTDFNILVKHRFIKQHLKDHRC